MFKKYKKQLIISSIVILLPIFLGLLLWNQLPEQIPTHWNTAGEVDNYSSRGFAVFGLPLFLLAVHWVCLFVTKSDKNNNNQTEKIKVLTMWIVPVISMIAAIAIYGTALGLPTNMIQLPCLLVGPMFLVIGNYLPKCKHNYTIGIKLPWTLANEANWNATHRFAGKVWAVGGLVITLCALLPEKVVFPTLITALLICVLLPTVYSYRYMKKHG